MLLQQNGRHTDQNSETQRRALDPDAKPTAAADGDLYRHRGKYVHTRANIDRRIEPLNHRYCCDKQILPGILLRSELLRIGKYGVHEQTKSQPRNEADAEVKKPAVLPMALEIKQPAEKIRKPKHIRYDEVLTKRNPCIQRVGDDKQTLRRYLLQHQKPDQINRNVQQQ